MFPKKVLKFKRKQNLTLKDPIILIWLRWTTTRKSIYTAIVVKITCTIQSDAISCQIIFDSYYSILIYVIVKTLFDCKLHFKLNIKVILYAIYNVYFVVFFSIFFIFGFFLVGFLVGGLTYTN